MKLKKLDKELIKELFPKAKTAFEKYSSNEIGLMYDLISKHYAYYDYKNKISIIDFSNQGQCTIGAYKNLEDGGFAIVVIFLDMKGACRYFRDDKDGHLVVTTLLNGIGEIIK